MKILNTLHISNLSQSSEVNEKSLCRLFVQFGEIEYVQCFNRRRSAIVKYYNYTSAFVAKDKMQNKYINGQSIKITWAKNHYLQKYLENFRGIKDPEVEI